MKLLSVIALCYHKNYSASLTTILTHRGLDCFRLGSQGRPADLQYDTERVFENVTKMFKSFVTTQKPDPDSLGSDTNYVTSFMRSGNMSCQEDHERDCPCHNR